MCTRTILLAEDDSGHEALFRRAVTQSGLECRMDVVRDGAEVIDYLFLAGEHERREPAIMPDLILLDLKMPKMDGLQVLQVLRRVRGDEQTRFPPIVVLTSSDHDADIVDAYRWGAQSYICKPLDYAEFSDAVGRTLQYWLGLNRSVPPRHLHVDTVPEIL